MTRFLKLLVIGVAFLGVSACGGGDSHEDLAKESISTLMEFGNTLAKVTDKASAEQHVAELDRLGARIKDLQARMRKLGTQLDSEAAEAVMNLQPEMEEAMAKVNRELGRIAMNPELKSVIGPVLERMDKWR